MNCSYANTCGRRIVQQSLITVIVIVSHLSSPMVSLSSAESDERPSEPTRWALMASHDERDKSIVDLLTMRLSQFTDVKLMERQDIERVLDELNLNAGGLVDAAKTVQFGGLAAADVLVLIEHETKAQPPLLRMRLIETRSGTRITDLLIDPGDLEQETAGIEAALKHAHSTVNAVEGQRRYIGLLGIGNEEPGQLLTPVARTLSVLVQQDLQLVPSLVVLEREQLDRLTAERNLTALEQELRSSTLLVEGGIRRRSDEAGYRITLKIVFLNGRPARELVVTTDTRDIAEVRRRISSAVELALDTETKDKTPFIKTKHHSQDEAKSFARRCDWLRSVDRHDEATSLAEAALALDPSIENARRACNTYYAVAHQHNRLAKHHFDEMDGGRPIDKGHHESHSALTAALRLGQLDFNVVKTRIAGNHPPADLSPIQVFTPRIVQPRDGDRPDNQRLRQEMDRLQLEKYRLVLAATKRGKQNVAGLLIRRLEHASRLAESPAGFIEMVRALVPRIDSEIAVASDQQRQGLTKNFIESLIKSIDHARRSEDQRPAFDSPRQWPLDSVLPLFHWLTEQKNGKLRFVGYYGLCLIPGDEGAKSARLALDILFATDAPIVGLETASLRAVSRLKDAGQGEEYFDQWLTRAKQKNKPEWLVRWPRTLFVFTSGSNNIKADWYRRCLQLLSTGKFEDGFAGRAESLQRRLTQRLAELDESTPSHVEENPTTGPWKEYTVKEIKFERPSDYRQFIGAHIDRNDARLGEELVLVWTQRNGEACAGSASINGGPMRQIGRSFPHEPVGAGAGWRLKIATSPDAVFVATGSPGLVMLTRNETHVFDQDDGAPADQILAMVWLKDALYVSFASSLARFDPSKKKFTLIASSHSLQSRNVLDGGRRYFIRTILADHKTNELYLDIHGSSGNSRSGIWKYEHASGKLESVFDSSRTRHRSRIIWSDGEVFFMANQHWYSIDPKTAKVRSLDDHAPFQIAYKGRIQNPDFIRINDHIVGANGQIYPPDGREYRRPMTYAWQMIGHLKNGALVANFDTSINRLWHIEPR